MTTVGYGPLWRVDGPLPIAPLYGLLQAASAPAAGVRIVVDVENQAVSAALEQVEASLARVNALCAAGASEADILAAVLEAVDVQSQFEAAGGVERWINGVEVYPYPPGPAHVWDACAAGSDAVEKDFGTDLDHPQFGAMTVYLAETCTTYKVWDQAAFKARAIIAFSAIEGAAVAKEFLTGDVLGLNPHLSDGNGVFPNLDAATNPQNALALLEKEIAATGTLGLIHMSPQMITVLANYKVLDDKTGVFRTPSGNVIIADAGYGAGATPAGHAAATGAEEWMYATGPVDIRRSAIFTLPDDVSQAVERGSGGASTGRPNSITYRVERYYAVDWDGELQAAVLADRCKVTC